MFHGFKHNFTPHKHSFTLMFLQDEINSQIITEALLAIVGSMYMDQVLYAL